jgi:hypothetical protein
MSPVRSEWLYRSYGLLIGANRPLVGLAPVVATGPVDIRVEFAATPPGDPPSHPAIFGGAPLRNDPSELLMGFTAWAEPSADGVALRLRYYGLGEETEATIDPSGRFIRVTGTNSHWPAETYPADHTSILLGSVLICALRLRGMLCLHAGVVAIDDGAVVILGEKGAGKSTCAAALVQHGCPLVADDSAVLAEDGEQFVAQPGYPRLRLWKASAEALLSGSSDILNLPRVLSPQDKYYVDLDASPGAAAWRFQAQPLPVRTIYLLTRSPECAAPAVEPLVASARLATLLAHTSVGFVPLSSPLRSREFARLSRLAATVPTRRVHCPEGLDRIGDLVDVLLADVRSIEGSPAPLPAPVA